MKNLFRLLRYVKKYPLNIVLALIAMLLQVASGFIVPYLMITIIDVAIQNGDMTLLITNSLLMLGTALVGLLSGLVNNYNSQYIAQYAGADLRLDLFKKIQSLSFSNIDKFKTSRLITSSTNDITRIQAFYQMMMRIILRAPLMIGFGLFMAIRTSTGLSRIFYYSMPILIGSIVIIMIIAFPKFIKVQKMVDGINKVALENVNAPRVIKSFVATEYENNRFEQANEDYRKTNTAAEKIMAFAEPIIMFIFNASIAGIIYLGSGLVQDGTLLTTTETGAVIPQVGVLMAFSNYSMQILFGLMMFAMMMIFISRAEASGKRINEIFDEVSDVLSPNDPIVQAINGGITFEDVSFSYGDKENLVLRNVSFNVNKGETIGIIGSTGSGKTSLISLIPRLYDVTSGSIKIDGTDVKEYDLHNLRNTISVVTQQATIFSGSIGTNIAQGTDNLEYDTFKDASEKAAAYEFIESYEDYFNHEIQPKGSNLSGGQKQRLSLARAFIRKPKILILDDSTSAVDAQSEDFIINTIRDLSGDMTTLVISQKISTIKDMDNIIVLNNKGQLDGFGTHEELLQSSKVYKEIALSQVGTGGADNE
jgi:ATP-binding cassette subfamily B protein